ncbi:MAG: LCP family protein [Anaerolineales bacterium]
MDDDSEQVEGDRIAAAMLDPAFDSRVLAPSIDSLSDTQSTRRRVGRGCRACGLLFLGLLLLMVLTAGLFLFSAKPVTVLVLGIDREQAIEVGRTDTMILIRVDPRRGYVGMLSIPRDLWVTIPGVGQNRINTAYHFAELQQLGTGLQAAVQVVETNFGLQVDHYIGVRFDVVGEVVDALGGVPNELEQPSRNLPAGTHLLNGEMAVAFVRSRAGSDDIHRMANSQLFFKALMHHMLNPQTWPRIPDMLLLLRQEVESDLPLGAWLRLITGLVRAGPGGIDARTIDWNMVRPVTTAGGAQVMEPVWERILPVVKEMFGS